MIILRQRSYSKDYYFSYDRPAGHFRRNQDKYLVGGGSILGAGIGYAAGGKKGAAIGAGIGSVAGLHGLVGKRLYDVNHQSKKKKKLKAGDMVKFTKKGPQLGQHYGVYDGEGGIIDYGENGISTTSLEEIKKSSKYKKMKVEPAEKESTKEELLSKATKLKDKYSGDNYNFVDNNCEHFARELSTGKRSSTQGDDLLGKMAKLVVRKKDPYGRQNKEKK